MKTQSYGGPGRRSVDPTRQQLQQRIREVHAMRAAESDAKESKQQTKLAPIIAALQQTSGMACKAIAEQLGTVPHNVTNSLHLLIDRGVVDRIGGGGNAVYQLVGIDHDGIGLESAESILAGFRARAERKFPRRAKQSRKRSLQAA